ncbi:proline dehydrogenase family protein [Opitutus terrae]|uniref:L-glutamate gamma-semialdehyde dehydrogenase n=1 Tax=Opitutus terrae (strain DSM 11246 / JCM 15787 / PB90-1) TaxID=452637 RepID=B1ZUG1_OPITP|nr:proline dehydrogenase family protein [Opitutus terrae]ACB74004.1 Aldehyde Dehydrogenase [Opitutus terrae PB90-1]
MPQLFPLSPTLQPRIRQIGEEILAAMDARPAPSLFSKKGGYARLMEWSMRDPVFKAQLFRFVDVLPSLNSSADIVRHLQEYLGDQAVVLNPALKAGLAASSFAPGLLAGPVKANVVAMAAQFVAGETPADLVQRIRANTAAGIATTIDLLGETVVNDAEADAFLQRNLEVLDTVSRFLVQEPAPGFSDLGPRGPLPRLNLSVKISALTPEVQPADPENSILALKQRLRPILRRAAEVGALVNFDMESYKLKDLTLALFKSILEEPEFAAAPDSRPSTLDSQRPAKPAFGIALQAYLRDCETDLRALIAWARARRQPLDVRLVKGAYWDYETVLARQRSWPVPVWEHKAETDANYEKLSAVLLDNIDLITPDFATHNVRSAAHVIAQAEQRRIDPRAYEFQALYGMADELKQALRQRGHRVREYCAIGALLPGMAYLVRRLLENTSNEGFLRRKNLGEATKDELLRDPAEVAAQIPGAVEPTVPAGSSAAPQPFRNAANTDFTKSAARDQLRAALKSFADATTSSRLLVRRGDRRPLIIGGREISDREFLPAHNPAHPSQVLGYWARATIADADAAVAAARAAQPAWAARSANERATWAERVADLLETRRHELNALEILEAGKPWAEADADISEAVDFCRFYAAEIRRIDRPRVTQPVPGERCVERWLPRGTGVVIAPWNFPLAILCGLTIAPVVAGNTVIMKPAEQTSLVAAAFMQVLIEAGLPAGVVNFLPGLGEEVGDALVRNPNIDFVAFTGSRAVGLQIWAAAGQTAPGQANLKKVICEMGGKNALIIDNDADLDEAIPATLYSAFGFSGQKCSALSRLILLDEVHDRFVERLLAAAAALPVGDPAEPGTAVGPVIDAEAHGRILRMIETGRREATRAWQAVLPTAVQASGGHYVPPTIFTGVKPEHTLAREEIFGPVLAVLRARDLDEAFAIANSTDYALTGGLFSRSPRALQRAERELVCGNVYLNRGVTGAIVERHPFGGFKMSGSGTKAGGRGYLENFLFPRVIAENVLRRGFTPPEEGE